MNLVREPLVQLPSFRSLLRTSTQLISTLLFSQAQAQAGLFTTKSNSQILLCQHDSSEVKANGSLLWAPET